MASADGGRHDHSRHHPCPFRAGGLFWILILSTDNGSQKNAVQWRFCFLQIKLFRPLCSVSAKLLYPLSFAEKKAERKKLPHVLALRQIYLFFPKITKNDVAP